MGKSSFTSTAGVGGGGLGGGGGTVLGHTEGGGKRDTTSFLTWDTSFSFLTMVKVGEGRIFQRFKGGGGHKPFYRGLKR